MTLVAQQSTACAREGKRRNCLSCLHDATHSVTSVPVGLLTDMQSKSTMNNGDHFGGIVFG
jgi:hypothetical protein